MKGALALNIVLKVNFNLFNLLILEKLIEGTTCPRHYHTFKTIVIKPT